MVLPENQPPVSTNPKSARDYVTPHKISLLVLIKEFCSVKESSLPTKCETEDQTKRASMKLDETTPTWEHTVQEKRNFSIVMMKLILNPDMDLDKLINIIHPVMHPSTYQAFVDRLHFLRKGGISSVMDFMASLGALLVDYAPVIPIIQKSSVMGLFIRHMLLAFDKLSFSLVIKLCHQFHGYFDATFEKCLDESIEISNGDSPRPEDLDSGDDFQVMASQKQAEFFIAQQTALLQMNENAALSPYELQQKIKELMKGNRELVEVYYLSYLNSLRVKEYCGASHNLYHHFDRNTNIPQECKVPVASEDSNRSSRYAALNATILHAQFGHKDEALSALNEAIMVSQEVNDNVCLQYCLAWLYRLTTENKEVLIERLIAKSSELGLWDISSLGIQALTQLKSESTCSPSTVFEILSKSDVQNCQHSMAGIMGSTFTLRSALWHSYGQNMMALLSSEILLFMNTSDPVRGGVYHINEGFCLALRNIAIECASRGCTFQSAQVLALAKELFPPHCVHSHIWQLAELLVKFEKMLFLGKWGKADQLQKGISVFNQDEGKLRKAELLFHQGNLAEADSLLKELLNQCETTPVAPHFHVRTLLLRSELLSATPNYVVALPCLMTCLSKCRSHHLLLLECLTKVQVASVQMELGLTKQALILLDEILIVLLTHGTFYHRGSCCFLYARCLALESIQNNEKDSEKLKKGILDALSLSKRALDYLRKVKALRKMKAVLCWQAYIYNYLGRTSERNDAAYEYRNLEDELT